MLKNFSRWLFIKTHRAELLRCCAYAKHKEFRKNKGRMQGFADAMSLLRMGGVKL